MNNFFSRRRFTKELKKLARENTARGEPLRVMDDVVFKAMLGSDTEDSREALRSLLSACIRREVTSVRLANNDLIPAHLDAKSSRLDVHVTFNDGEVADLEMQMGKSDDDLKFRAALYSAMLLSGQSHKGGTYGEIKRVYQIFFLNCILFPQSNKLPRRYSYREETEHDRLTAVTEIIFYEMPKLEQRVQAILAGTTEMDLCEDEKWCMYMKYRHEERAAKLMEQLYREEAGIMRAERTVEKISRDYRKFAREMAITKNRMDRAQERYEGRKEGLATGHAEGQAKKALEIAAKMKKAGRPSGEIAEFTDLSLKTIEQLKS
jgi:predicted transposase/invertase (TIGR01784 family)